MEVELPGWDMDEEDDHPLEGGEDELQEDSDHDGWRTHRESLKQLCSRGWAVHITKVPLKKETWFSPDGGVEFDNEDDYDDYMIEWNRHELRLEREREDEEWADYYHQRQQEWYSRGYADDGGPA